MAIPEKRLPKHRRRKLIREINRWTAEQFRMKNLALANGHSGIHLSDRCPLDPLTFGGESERKGKASYLLDKITDEQRHPIVNGHLIYLDGSPEEIRQRGTYKHKHWKIREIEELIGKIEAVYGPIDKTVVCTRGRTATQVTRELSRIIFLDDYQEIDLADQLARHSRRRR